MRLIDADELIVFGIDDPENGGLFKFVPKDFIDQAPTIEAIPVEFIEEQIGECKACHFEEMANVFEALVRLWKNVAEEWERTKIEVTIDHETWDRLTEEKDNETD